MKKPKGFTDTEFELLQTIKIFEILEGRTGKEIVSRLYDVLKIDSFKDNEKGQRLAITYLTGKLSPEATSLFA